MAVNFSDSQSGVPCARPGRRSLSLAVAFDREGNRPAKARTRDGLQVVVRSVNPPPRGSPPVLREVRPPYRAPKGYARKPPRARLIAQTKIFCKKTGGPKSS